MVRRRSHNPVIGGSIPPPAPKGSTTDKTDMATPTSSQASKYAQHLADSFKRLDGKADLANTIYGGARQFETEAELYESITGQPANFGRKQ